MNDELYQIWYNLCNKSSEEKKMIYKLMDIMDALEIQKFDLLQRLRYDPKKYKCFIYNEEGTSFSVSLK